MASQPAERASGDVYSWEYAGSEEHAAGMQRAVRDDIIYDKHTGLCMTTSLHLSSDLPNLTAAQQHTHSLTCSRLLERSVLSICTLYAGLGNVRRMQQRTRDSEMYAGLGNVRGMRKRTRNSEMYAGTLVVTVI